MTETYVGSIDQGTTGTPFMLFDHDGAVVANAYERHEQLYPEPGWVEHDPRELWENTKAVVGRGLAESGVEPSVPPTRPGSRSATGTHATNSGNTGASGRRSNPPFA